MLSIGDILKLVNEYIGVHGGYLGDFTYRTHREFYPQFCDVEVDPDQYEGTTRERFIKVLGEEKLKAVLWEAVQPFRSDDSRIEIGPNMFKYVVAVS